MVPRYLYIQYINYDNAEGVTSGASSLHSKTITARFGRNRTSVRHRNLHDQCFCRWVVLISVVAPLGRYLTPRRNRRMVMWSAVVCINLPVMGDRSGEMKRVVMEREIRDRALSSQSAILVSRSTCNSSEVNRFTSVPMLPEHVAFLHRVRIGYVVVW